MNYRRLPHRIVRTRNKHSRAVLRENTVIIRLARSLSRTEEHEHIEYLLRRMAKVVLEEQRKVTINPFRSLLEGGALQIVRLATEERLIFRLVPGDRTRAFRTADGWLLTVSPHARRKSLHRLLWNCLARSEGDRIGRLVHRINAETLNVGIRGVRVGFASSQWGSCSPRGIIMINAALLFLRPALLRYIIIHELAHRRRADHSPAFWREVESVLPGYEKLRKELHDYRLPTL